MRQCELVVLGSYNCYLLQRFHSSAYQLVEEDVVEEVVEARVDLQNIQVGARLSEQLHLVHSLQLSIFEQYYFAVGYSQEVQLVELLSKLQVVAVVLVDSTVAKGLAPVAKDLVEQLV